MLPAIFFEPDGYVLPNDKVMGRQAAGDGFLRAAIDAANSENGIYAYTASKSSADTFKEITGKHSAQLPARWCQPDDYSQISRCGGIYFPGPNIGSLAQFRLRAGAASYSLTGITHTTASHQAMDALTSLLTTPVMPWDALICTSSAVVETVQTLLSEQAEFLEWRFGKDLDFTLPATPMIPLGVHLDDFACGADDRRKARMALGIEPDAVVMLFAGRLSFHAKAHPHAMYLAAERVAQETGKKLVLIQNGWFANDAIEAAFQNGAAQYAPSVSCLFTDGRSPEAKRQSWAASDIFISLSDNIQETFGLTPIEAMAAGIPAVVSDWNGYKDTVRDGVDGFRIPTHMPEAGFGSALAARHEAGIDNYDFYCGLSCQVVSVDHDALVKRLSELVLDPALRRQMGDAGQRRAREVYDWKVIFAQYMALWDQQARVRKEVSSSDVWQAKLLRAPRQAANRLDPFLAFSHYSSEHILPATRLASALPEGATVYRRLIVDPLYSYAGAILPSVEIVESVLGAMPDAGISVQELAEQARLSVTQVVHVSAVLAKMGIVRLVSD